MNVHKNRCSFVIYILYWSESICEEITSLETIPGRLYSNRVSVNSILESKNAINTGPVTLFLYFCQLQMYFPNEKDWAIRGAGVTHAETVGRVCIAADIGHNQPSLIYE